MDKWIILLKNDKKEAIIIDGEQEDPDIYLESGWEIEKDAGFGTVQEAVDDARAHGLWLLPLPANHYL